MGKKYVLEIQWGDTRSWNEIFYGSNTGEINSSLVTTAARQLARERAKCLNNNCKVVACKVYDTIDTNRVNIVSANFQGALGTGLVSNDAPDVPNLALLVGFSGEDGARRSYLMRGLCDGDIVRGKITFAYSGVAPYNTFLRFIVATAFNIRKTQIGVGGNITSISGLGVVLSPGAAPDAPSQVLIKTQTAGGGKKIRWQGKQTDRSTAGQFTLKNWKWGNAEGGTYKYVTQVFPAITAFAFETDQEARTRKTGSKKGRSRGRQSARR